MPNQHSKTGYLPLDLEKALREAGIAPDTDLPVLDLDLDPVPVSHASGPAEHQPDIDENIQRQWREWRQRHPDRYNDYAFHDPAETARDGTDK